MDQETMRNLLMGMSRLNQQNQNITGQKPPKIDAKVLRSAHRQYLNQLTAEGSIPFAKRSAVQKVYCSSNPLESLRRTRIADLKINVPAKGFYLLLRTLEVPYHDIGITTIVEDHEGDVFHFCAYNLVSSDLEPYPEDIFPVGTFFILKEPFLKPGLAGGFLIRCDSPSDLITISMHHKLYAMAQEIKWKNKIDIKKEPLPSCAESWKTHGNDFFDKRKYLLAVDCYLTALHLSKTSEKRKVMILRLNLSLTYIHLNSFELALEYAVKALENDPKNLKGLYRAGRATYELRQFGEAKSYFEKLVALDRNNQEGQKEFKRCVLRLKEAKGDIKVYDFYQISKSNPFTRIDCADYVGPLEVLRNSEGHGRSVVASKNIKPGTLLVVSKAIIAEFPAAAHQLNVYVNPNETEDFGATANSVQELCQIVFKNPKTIGTAVYDLPIEDGFLDSVKPKIFCDVVSKEEPIADVERLRKILTTNGVTFGTLGPAGRPFGHVGGQASSCGLFIFPSYMNHSCLANVWWTTYGDIMVIYASKYIKSGEEVTISYVDPVLRFSEKVKELAKRELSCHCKLCEIDRKEPERLREKRETLTLSLEKSSEEYCKYGQVDDKIHLPDIMKYLAKTILAIEKLYKAGDEKKNQCYLAMPYWTVATFSSMVNNEFAIIYLWKGISALGFDDEIISLWSKGEQFFAVPGDAVFSNHILHFLEILVIFYDRQGLLRDAKKYLRSLFVAHRVQTGANREMTLASFSSIPANLL